jgi:Raf kinase inhibitor-like YbhB/YbcL family protein
MKTVTQLKLSSPSFNQGAAIPVRYTCDGTDINPAIRIEGIPADVSSLAVLVEDPDAPAGNWVHWVVWNIKPAEEIGENSIPGIEGVNDFRKHHYGGPCPPSGTHRYFFRVFALDRQLNLPADAGKEALQKSMQGNILAQGELMGTYRRNRN